MTRLAALCLACVLVTFGLGCASDNRSASPSDMAVGKLSYDEAVKSMRRPPASARTTAEGDLVATWITEVRGGHKYLVLTFGRDRILKSHHEELR